MRDSARFVQNQSTLLESTFSTAVCQLPVSTRSSLNLFRCQNLWWNWRATRSHPDGWRPLACSRPVSLFLRISCARSGSAGWSIPVASTICPRYVMLCYTTSIRCANEECSGRLMRVAYCSLSDQFPRSQLIAQRLEKFLLSLGLTDIFLGSRTRRLLIPSAD